ncbi:MAG: HNH endonuclease [Saprospiraceae bacterium]|nr:HNH endonuclease [Saprospiraceae bacterium]
MKPLDDFYNRASARDGKMSRCKDCQNAITKAHRIKKTCAVPAVGLQLFVNAGDKMYHGVTQSMLRYCFEYRDGVLYWKNKILKSPRKVGDVFGGSVNNSGYIRCGFMGKDWLVHRAIFFYHHGWLPEFIDHIDGDKTNNKIDNLRMCTHSQNHGNNTKRNTKSSSNYKGVSRNAAGNWRARVKAGGEQIYIGSFRSELAAAKAYDSCARGLFGCYCRTNFPLPGERQA